MKQDRIKRRVLQEAVDDNVETIKGLVPKSLRPARRFAYRWARRSLLVLLPATLLGSTYFVAGSRVLHIDTAAPSAAAMVATPAVTAPASFVRRSHDISSKTFAKPEALDPAVLSLDVKRIVIDAGHGGLSPGTSASAGLLEKEVTLDIAKRLKARLERERFQVVMTREGDQTLTLNQRATMANRSRGDVFVSIHLNWLKNPENRGIETYYLGPTNDPVLNQMVAAENRESGYSLSDMRKLLDGIYADVRQDESRRLADSLQRQLYTNLKSVNPHVVNRGVKTAPFVVLVATEMPAVLAEVSCLSNQQETEMLKTPEYRQRIADALFSGIQTYATHGETEQKGI